MSDLKKEIWLMRHGETEWSVSGAHTSRTDLPLLPAGIKQAQELAPKLKNHKFALVMVSPMHRAQETCRLAGLSDGAVVTDDLKEWDYGLYEGRSTTDIHKENPGWMLWRDGVPQGESLDQVKVRVQRVIQRCLEVDGDAALFAHGHVLRILTAVWLNMPPGNGEFFALNTGSMSVLGFEHDYHVIRRWNCGSV
jgi:probable phosphoglycerate mutase